MMCRIGIRIWKNFRAIAWKVCSSKNSNVFFCGHTAAPRFHLTLYQEAGINPEDIRSLEDVRLVPKVEKSMMQSIQRKDPFPYGDALCTHLDDVCVFRQTSGTTGQPVYQADTWQDWEWWTDCWATLLWAQGYRPHDRVFLPFGYNVFVAFWAAHYASEKIGCETIPGGVLDTRSRVPENPGIEGHRSHGHAYVRIGHGSTLHGISSI